MEQALKNAIKLAEDRNYKDALQLFDDIVKKQPANIKALNGRANCKQALEDFHGALEDFEKALQLEPDNYKLLNNLGNLCYEVGNYEQALKHYSKSIAVNGVFETYRNRGNTYSKVNEQQKAINDFNKALELNNNDFQCWSNIGNSYESLGDIENALKYWKKALQLNPAYFYAKWKIQFHSRPIAKKSDWKHLPLSENKILLEPNLGMQEELFDGMKKGMVPKGLNDKWFIYHENNILYCHHADTGHCIYELHFEKDGTDYYTRKIWVEDDPGIYQAHEKELLLLIFLLHVGLCYGYFGPMVKQSYLSSLLDDFSFDELHERFGSLLQD